jgi:hypothetical protein
MSVSLIIYTWWSICYLSSHLRPMLLLNPLPIAWAYQSQMCWMQMLTTWLSD